LEQDQGKETPRREDIPAVVDGAGITVVDGAEVADVDGAGVAARGRRRRPISGAPPARRALLSPSRLPFLPGADVESWRQIYACSSSFSPRAQLLLFPRARSSSFPAPRERSFSFPAPRALSLPRRPPQRIRRLGDDFCCEATPYPSRPRRARRRISKTAQTTWRRLGDALKTMLVTFHDCLETSLV
jgi:hypothetical protein